MELSAREDVEAPAEAVFRAVTDFARFERAVLRRGAEIARTDDLAAPGEGMCWRIRYQLRGRRREAELEMLVFEPPEKITAIGRGSGIAARFDVLLIPLSPARTRMDFRSEFRANTLSGRLLLQPARLARGNLLRRYRRAVAEFAGRIEDRQAARGRGGPSGGAG